MGRAEEDTMPYAAAAHASCSQTKTCSSISATERSSRWCVKRPGAGSTTCFQRGTGPAPQRHGEHQWRLAAMQIHARQPGPGKSSPVAKGHLALGDAHGCRPDGRDPACEHSEYLPGVFVPSEEVIQCHCA